ncbi:MAG TPA: dihydrolipoamide acetyltransferase family protein [Actinocrinis sp.]|jgi:pyruvate dehydrogenase E2 component (dihydrolipoamide acetyltransferase)|uniref:dihydrolipoamide acetyltransferase family protein n=1 Tax=Actinocrinis sp. TaxID=1920516 RepID=UPI002DDD43CF|nr:dihydrolipoamide acetyltransferase family protein [Actinocrinis sp.]HEV3170170.1 dihydrolipoamide acetyltransferase family protein [Actinocrinis sp.]
MAVKQFRLPDVGEGLTEAEILGWSVAVGDEVKVNQVLVEIETAKAAVELPSPYAGVVRELLVEAGSTVDVGTPIISIETADAEPGAPAGDSGSSTGAEKREPVLVGYGVAHGSTKRRARKPAPGSGAAAPSGGAVATASAPSPAAPVAPVAPAAVPVPAPVAQASAIAAAPEPITTKPTFVLAKPLVRKLAKDLGVDLTTITPEREDGVITREQVERAAVRSTAPAAAAPSRLAPLPETRRVPIKGVRKATAAAMVSSAFTAPHVTEFLTLDVTRTVKLVARLKELPEYADVKVSPLLLVAKALLLGVAKHPDVNASWDELAQEIVIHGSVNLGIAAATPRGLVVPNIKSAERLTLHDLAVALGELTATARAGKTALEDLTGGTITITNVGVFGVDTGTPIINPGEAAILAFGAIKQQPWVHKGKIKPRWVTTLGLSFDHRMIDGELGSKFLRDVGRVLEDPVASLV